MGSLPRRRPQAVPGVAHLMIMYLRQIVGVIERQRLDVEPAYGAEQGIGSDDPLALGADPPRLCQDQILLRVQDVDRGALAALRFPADALQGNGCGAHFGFGSGDRDLGAFMSDPGAGSGGAGLISDLVEYEPALRRQLLGLPGLRGGRAAVIDRRRHLAEDRSLVGPEGAERGIAVSAAAGAALQRNGRQQGA